SSDVTKKIVNRALAMRRTRKLEPINRAQCRQSPRTCDCAGDIVALSIDPPCHGALVISIEGSYCTTSVSVRCARLGGGGIAQPSSCSRFSATDAKFPSF